MVAGECRWSEGIFGKGEEEVSNWWNLGYWRKKGKGVGDGEKKEYKPPMRGAPGRVNYTAAKYGQNKKGGLVSRPKRWR